MDTTPIQFQSADEFELLPGYEAAMRCTPEQLERIVGKYAFDKARQLRCGLNGCNRTHWHGYVISAKDGRKTHCGQDCGKREFGVTFDEVEATFRRAEAAAARASNIAEAVRERDALLARADSIMGQTSQWAKKVSDLLGLIDREPSMRRALDGALRDGGRIRRAAKVDRELLAVMGQRSGAAQLETIGVVAGGQAVMLHREVAAHVRSRAVWILRPLTGEVLAGLSEKDLAIRSREITDARQALQDAESFIGMAARFTSSENKRELAKLLEVVPSRSRTQRASKIAKRLAEDDRVESLIEV
jgi:hypothetical protein